MPSHDTPPPLPPANRTELLFEVRADDNLVYAGYERTKADAAFQKAIADCGTGVIYKVRKYVYGDGGVKQD